MKGYWQVPLTDRAKEVCAFVTPEGLYQPTVMAFGLKNAPATFQRLMNGTTRNLTTCTAYIDDIVVYSMTWREYLDQLANLFKRLEKAHLVINLKKSEFEKAEITYVGHVVGTGAIRPKDAKIKAIVDMPAPSNKKALQRFLGMAGFYRRYVRNFSHIASPLTELLKKQRVYNWDQQCQTAFESPKAVLMSHPILRAPDFYKTFTLAVNACAVSVGAVLLQKDDNGVDRPVAYFSKKLNSHQVNYSAIEKETFALVSSLHHFEIYVTSGGTLTVLTDHNPFTYINNFKNSNSRLMRWALFLQNFD